MRDVMRHVLMVGADREQLDRVAPMLRRAEFDVHTVADSAMVPDLVRCTPFELLVVVYPPREYTLDVLVRSVRDENSPCRNAGLMLLADAASLEEAHAYVNQGVNRAVGMNWASARLWRVVGDLVNVAPRVFLRALVEIGVRTDLASYGDLCRSENISSSGMLLRAFAVYPPSTAFDFEFAVPDQDRVIDGSAEIVRRADADREGVVGFGARFLSIRGTGRQRLEQFIRRQLSSAPNPH